MIQLIKNTMFKTMPWCSCSKLHQFLFLSLSPSFASCKSISLRGRKEFLVVKLFILRLLVTILQSLPRLGLELGLDIANNGDRTQNCQFLRHILVQNPDTSSKNSFVMNKKYIFKGTVLQIINF